MGQGILEVLVWIYIEMLGFIKFSQRIPQWIDSAFKEFSKTELIPAACELASEQVEPRVQYICAKVSANEVCAHTPNVIYIKTRVAQHCWGKYWRLSRICVACSAVHQGDVHRVSPGQYRFSLQEIPSPANPRTCLRNFSFSLWAFSYRHPSSSATRKYALLMRHKNESQCALALEMSFHGNCSLRD